MGFDVKLGKCWSFLGKSYPKQKPIQPVFSRYMVVYTPEDVTAGCHNSLGGLVNRSFSFLNHGVMAVGEPAGTIFQGVYLGWYSPKNFHLVWLYLWWLGFPSVSQPKTKVDLRTFIGGPGSWVEPWGLIPVEQGGSARTHLKHPKDPHNPKNWALSKIVGLLRFVEVFGC